MIAGLKARDARPIIAADYSARRRELALTMGADIVVDPAVDSPYTSWRDAATIADPKAQRKPWAKGPSTRPAVIFECVGVPGVIDQIMERAPKRARIVVVGVCMQPDHFHPLYAINKELNVQFVLGYTREEFAGTLHAIAAGVTNVAPLITARVGIDGVAGAFTALGTPDIHAKILVEPWRSATDLDTLRP